jgi:hypothetical protein
VSILVHHGLSVTPFRCPPPLREAGRGSFGGARIRTPRPRGVP